MNSYSKFFMSFLAAILINVLSASIGYASDEVQHQADNQPESQSEVATTEELTVESDTRMRIFLPIVCIGGNWGSAILCVDDNGMVVPCDREPPGCVYGSCPPLNRP